MVPAAGQPENPPNPKENRLYPYLPGGQTDVLPEVSTADFNWEGKIPRNDAMI